MTERELELRLAGLAQALDAVAPEVDPRRLRAAGSSRRRPTQVVVAIIVSVAALGVASAAVASFDDLFGVDSVSELDQPPPDVVLGILGRHVTGEQAAREAPFAVRNLSSLGMSDGGYVRDDVTGGMVTLSYEGGQILLTQWPAEALEARVAVVPSGGIAEEVAVGSLRALWFAGMARGTFTLIGADGAVHREQFAVAAGALLWRDGDVALLLQGAGTKERAVRLAALARP